MTGRFSGSGSGSGVSDIPVAIVNQDDGPLGAALVNVLGSAELGGLLDERNEFPFVIIEHDEVHAEHREAGVGFLLDAHQTLDILVQNIQLAAWAEGLGMQWNTGKQTQQTQTYDLLGIDPAAEEIAGFLYFGYPAIVPPPVTRKQLSEVMRRLP